MSDMPITEDVILPRGHHRISWACPEHPTAGVASVAEEWAHATALGYWIAHLRAVPHRRIA